MTTETDFDNFIKSIPEIVHPQLGLCNLRQCIENSAVTNAQDTPGGNFWEVALETAKFIFDDWMGFYGCK